MKVMRRSFTLGRSHRVSALMRRRVQSIEQLATTGDRLFEARGLQALRASTAHAPPQSANSCQPRTIFSLGQLAGSR